MNWYYGFMLAVLLLWGFSTDRDRAALRIVLIATLASHFIVLPVTHQIAGTWKLAIPGIVETATIMALFRWAPNKTGFIQAACLTVAWVAHLLCYLDCELRTDLVYSHYESIIALVAVAQLAGFHDTISHIFRGLVEWIVAAFRSRDLGPVRTSSVCDPVLRDTGVPRV